MEGQYPRTMAGRPTPQGGRTVAGLTWAARGLLGFLVAAVVTAVGLVVFIPLYNLPAPDTFQAAQLRNSLTLLSWTVLGIDAVSGITYSAGLAGIFGGRRDYGPDHARSVEQSLPWLLVSLVLFGSAIIVSSLTGPFLGFPGIGYVPPSWTVSASVVLAGLRAIFAGLTLYYAVQVLAEEDERIRLLIGMALGVAGAVVWSGLAAYAGEVGTLSAAALIPYLAGILAGLGTSAISLALFAAVYREIRENLKRGPRPAAS